MHAFVETEGDEVKEQAIVNNPPISNPAISQFIQKNDLDDLSDLLVQSKLKLIHLRALNDEKDMSEFDALCTDWNLNAAQKIRFGHAIKSLKPIQQRQRYETRLTILGDTSTGKTSLAKRMTGRDFSEYQESTIGAGHYKLRRDIYEKSITYEIWDTAGQERYQSLAPMYYKHASIIFVVYDITSAETFYRGKFWVKEIQNNVGKIPILVIGNKIDRDDEREVDVVKVEQYTNSMGISHIEVSCKTKHNLSAVYQWIRENTLDDDLRKVDDNAGFKLNEGSFQREPGARKRKCCG